MDARAIKRRKNDEEGREMINSRRSSHGNSIDRNVWLSLLYDE